MSTALQKGAALPCDMERLVEVGRRHGVAVIEVANCAIGSETLWNGEWQKIGKPHGDVSCFLPKGLDQRSVMQALLDKGISTRRGIMCSHREPAYAELALRQELPWSEQAQDECILLPLYAQMSDREQREVVDALREAVLRR